MSTHTYTPNDIRLIIEALDNAQDAYDDDGQTFNSERCRQIMHRLQEAHYLTSRDNPR
jgi:hypothetical protein